MSHVYEREFKSILSGDRKWIERTSWTLPAKRCTCLKMMERFFIAIRVASSFGVDLVTIRNDIAG